MADFRILTDTDVQNLLKTSDHTELSRFADILTQAFHSYSTTDEAKYQPERAAVKRPSGQGTLFMPSTSPSTLGVKIVGLPPPQSKGRQEHQQQEGPKISPPTLKATMTLCDHTGRAIGTLNAGALTAFRTSLGAMLPLRSRRTVKHVVMFGSGKQAFWHLRLAAILRGHDIQTMTVINRSKPRAEELIASLQQDEVFRDQHPHITIEALTPDEDDGEEYQTNLKTLVQRANSIHCAVPSTSPLFPADWILSRPTLEDLYISAIGSYRLDMQELDPQLLRSIIAEPNGYILPGRSTPVVLVDSRAACFEEAGEVVAAGLTAEQVLEAGELEDVLQTMKKGGESGEEEGVEMKEWLATGLVVYKSVGFGVMDLCIGTALFELAREKGVGVTVPDFG